jgi:hypothetical protein
VEGRGGRPYGVVKVDVQREEKSDDCWMVVRDKDGKEQQRFPCAVFFFGGGSATVDSTQPGKVAQSGSRSIRPQIRDFSVSLSASYVHLDRYDQNYIPFFTGGVANGSFALEEDVKMDGYSVGPRFSLPIGKLFPGLGPLSLYSSYIYTSASSSTSRDSIPIPAGQTADIPNILGGPNTAVTSIQAVRFDSDFSRHMIDIGLMGKDDLCEEGETNIVYGTRIKFDYGQQNYDFQFLNGAQANRIEQDIDTYRIGALGNLGVSRGVLPNLTAGFGALFGFGMQKTVYDARQSVGAASREVHAGGLWHTAPELGVYGRLGYRLNANWGASLGVDHRYDFYTPRPIIASENNSGQPSHIEYTTTSETRVTFVIRGSC